MGFYARLHTFATATFGRIRGSTHQERLEAYYRSQADSYDEFREYLLHGRRKLIEALPVKKGDRIVEFGAGTGWIAETLGEKLSWCESYTMVDLCRPLMAQARLRKERLGWSNVTIVEADAAEFIPGHPVDIVVCSYCLTMMPRWFAVMDRAHEILRAGGIIAATDFYTSQTNPETGSRRHSAWQRCFWPACFAWHHVWLSADHVPYLRHRFATQHFSEHLGRMPFMAGLRAPYYVFLGSKQLPANFPDTPQ